MVPQCAYIHSLALGFLLFHLMDIRLPYMANKPLYTGK